MRLKWMLVSVGLEIVLILTQDRCTVCTKHTIGSEIVLDAPDGTTGWRGSCQILFRFVSRWSWTLSHYHKPHIYLQFQIAFISFLLVFSIRLQESLLGEVNHVRVVDNQWSSGVTIAGSESVLVWSLNHEHRVSTNRRYHTFWKIGPSLHQVVLETLLPVRYNFVFPFRLLLFLHYLSSTKS